MPREGEEKPSGRAGQERGKRKEKGKRGEQCAMGALRLRVIY